MKKSADATLIAAVTDKLAGVSRPDAKGWHTALCPFHDDHHPSLRFNERGFKCMACGEGGGLRKLAAKLGIAVPEADSPGLTLAELADKKGLEPSFLNNIGVADGFSGSGSNRRPCVDIPYMSQNGELVAVQKRLSLNGSPRFIWRRGDHPVPYGLWRLDEARSRGYVIIVEGPSDCWTLWTHKFPALGLPGATTWKDEYSQLLSGLTVFLWVEPDQGGEILLKSVSSTMPDVRVIQPPKGVKDPSELFLADRNAFGKVIESLMSAAKAASELQIEVVSKEVEQLSGQALALAGNPSLFEELKKAIAAQGYAGDVRPALCAYVALTSRLTDRPLNLIYVAQSASGKNASIEAVLGMFPADTYVIVRASSPMALVYSTEDFAHKMVILWEADSLPEEGPAASAVRSLLSDQRLEYEVVEKNDSGRHAVRKVVKEGPTGLITTSTKPLREQASTRMLTVCISDTAEQTKAVLDAIADKETGLPIETDSSQWVALQRWLALGGEHRVTVPFARAISDLLPSGAVRIRRDFSHLLGVIKAIALLHQAQRPRNERGYVLATIDDYKLARWLLEDIFTATTSSGLTPAIKETVQAVATLSHGGTTVSEQQLVDHFKLAKATISYRVKRAIGGGWLVNKSTQRGNPAQLVSGAPLPQDTLLPSAEDVLMCSQRQQGHSNTPTPACEQLSGESVLESVAGCSNGCSNGASNTSGHLLPEADETATVRGFESLRESATHEPSVNPENAQGSPTHWEKNL